MFGNLWSSISAKNTFCKIIYEVKLVSKNFYKIYLAFLPITAWTIYLFLS